MQRQQIKTQLLFFLSRGEAQGQKANELLLGHLWPGLVHILAVYMHSYYPFHTITQTNTRYLNQNDCGCVAFVWVSTVQAFRERRSVSSFFVKPFPPLQVQDSAPSVPEISGIRALLCSRPDNRLGSLHPFFEI